MKDLCLPDLNELHLKVLGNIQQDSLQKKPKNERLEKQKVFKIFHEICGKLQPHCVKHKGWLNERVIDTYSLEGGHVILALNDDPPAHIKKEVITMMEMELGDGWIFHKHCKVYLFISSQRVAGCFVAELIYQAYWLVTKSNEKSNVTTTQKEDKRLTSITLQFGGINFHRETVRKDNKYRNRADDAFLGAIICERDAMSALCGIHAVWVTPFN